MRLALLLAASFVGIGGCGANWKLEVDSDTAWRGSYTASSPDGDVITSVEGDGKRTFDVPDDLRVCASIELRGQGYVNVRFKDDGRGLADLFSGLLAEDPSTTVGTSAPGDTANICREAQ